MGKTGKHRFGLLLVVAVTSVLLAGSFAFAGGKTVSYSWDVTVAPYLDNENIFSNVTATPEFDPESNNSVTVMTLPYGGGPASYFEFRAHFSDQQVRISIPETGFGSCFDYYPADGFTCYDMYAQIKNTMDTKLPVVFGLTGMSRHDLMQIGSSELMSAGMFGIDSGTADKGYTAGVLTHGTLTITREDANTWSITGNAESVELTQRVTKQTCVGKKCTTESVNLTKGTIKPVKFKLIFERH